MRQILWVSFLLCIACYITGPIVDPDLWWHIMSGRWILSHRALPQADYWNMFGVGQEWRAYSWSNEIAYALAERYWGIKGLLSLKYLLAALIVFSFGFSFSRLSNDWFLGAILATFGAGACVSHFTLRPQSLVWALFALALYLAQRIHEEGFTKRRAAALALVFIVWANTHVTTILGLAAVFALAYSRERPREVLKVLAIAFVSTLITPYFGGEWRALFNQASHPFDMRSIAEFKPATIMQFPTAFLILSVALFGVLSFFGRRLAEPMRLLGLGAAAIAGLAVIKFLPLASIYVISLVAIEWRYAIWAGPTAGLLEGINRLRRFILEKIPPEGLSFVLLCMAAVFVFNLFKAPISNRIIPVAAVDFIQKHELPHPILNDFGRGGYMMYRFGDKDGQLAHLVPVDGRTNVVPKEVWRKHEAAQFGKESWREYLDLVKPATILWSNESPLSSILIAEGKWCRVFRSGDSSAGFSVYVPRDFFNAHAAELPSDTCKS